MSKKEETHIEIKLISPSSTGEWYSGKLDSEQAKDLYIKLLQVANDHIVNI